MELDTKNTGILDAGAYQHWFAGSHDEPDRASSDAEELNELVDDLIRTTEIDTFIRNTCLNFLARFNVTSWEGDHAAISFWCNGFDATFRSHVARNPINRLHPPLCLLSVQMGEAGHNLYGSLTADLNDAGPLLLCHAVRSLLLQALGHGGESCD